MSALWRGAARAKSTTTASSNLTYPFSKTALVRAPPTSPMSPSLRRGKGLMEYLRKTLPTSEKQKMLAELFSRRSPKALIPGSIVSVTSEHAPTSFTGVLMAMRRRGPDTSLILRNIISRTGVEMRFLPCSPHVKEIELIQKPPRRYMRRAKLFYLRNTPEKMSMLAGR